MLCTISKITMLYEALRKDSATRYCSFLPVEHFNIFLQLRNKFNEWQIFKVLPTNALPFACLRRKLACNKGFPLILLLSLYSIRHLEESPERSKYTTRFLLCKQNNRKYQIWIRVQKNIKKQVCITVLARAHIHTCMWSRPNTMVTVVRSQ